MFRLLTAQDGLQFIAACLNEDEAEKVMGCGSTAPASFFVLHKSKDNKIENGHLHDILYL